MEVGIICYPVVITKEAKSGVCVVEFPDLLGCFAQGNSLGEAICNAQEALAVYFTEKNGKLPPASDFGLLTRKYPGAIIQMVVINISRCIAKSLRATKKTLTIPEWLNTLSEKYHVNFSRILKTVLINYLSNLDNIDN